MKTAAGTENTIIEKKAAPEAKESPKAKGITEFSFFIEKERIRKLLPHIVTGLFISLFYIFNAHRGQRLMREADTLRREIKELRAEYISLKSEQEYRSKLSQVAEKLEDYGLQELRTPPFVIYYDKRDRKP